MKIGDFPPQPCPPPSRRILRLPKCQHLRQPSDELAMRIPDKTGVAVLSGRGFGPHGEGYLRLCYANSLENIERALGRLAEFFAKIERP